MARLVFFDPRKLWNEDGTLKNITELDEDTARIIAGFDCVELFSGSGEECQQAGVIKKFKFPDRTRTLELAMRHLKMLTDRVELTGGAELIRRLQHGRRRSAQLWS